MKKPPGPERFLPLKPHWFHVMLSLAGQEQHGYGIMQEVLERTENKVHLWPATLYGTLKRLIDEELIEESERRCCGLDRSQDERLTLPSNRDGVSFQFKPLRQFHELASVRPNDFSNFHRIPPFSYKRRRA